MLCYSVVSYVLFMDGDVVVIAFAIYSALLQNLRNFEMYQSRISLRTSAHCVGVDLSLIRAVLRALKRG